MKHSVSCLEFRPYRRNTLCGFAKARIDAINLVIHDVALHAKGNSRWVQLPAKPVLRDGRHVADEATGKDQYTPCLEFEGRETRDAFSHALWAAVLDRYPDALAEVETAS
jgi:hypothetical protein